MNLIPQNAHQSQDISLELIENNIYTDATQPVELAKYIAKKYCYFDEKELDMIDMFWEPTFNRGWIYVSDDIVRDDFGHKQRKDMMYNFVKKLKTNFEKDMDYQEVSPDYPLLNLGSISNTNEIGRHGGQNKKYYIITGETYKALLMLSKTIQGKQIRNYYIKIETLSIKTLNILTQCAKYIADKKNLENENKLLEKDIKLLIAQNKNLQLTTLIKNNEMLKIDGWIYIATTLQYSRNNQYKIGRTASISERMTHYQCGRAKNDAYYYVYAFKSEDVKLLELIIRRLLIKYRDDRKKDMYVLRWNILRPWIEKICIYFHDGMIVETNKLIIENFECLDDEQENVSVIPELFIFEKDVCCDGEENFETYGENDDFEILSEDDDFEVENEEIYDDEHVTKRKNCPPGYRKCRKCEKEKLKSDGFEMSPDGINYYPYCIPCRKEIYLSKTNICKKCRKTKPKDNFLFPDGTYSRNCSACREIYPYTF
jgi:phage anti-repressor protein